MSDQLDSLLARFGAIVAGWTQDTPLAEMRAALDAHYTNYPEAPQTRVTHIASPVPGEWGAAEGAAANRALLLLHGGGFSMGSARAHRPFGFGRPPKRGPGVVDRRKYERERRHPQDDECNLEQDGVDRPFLKPRVEKEQHECEDRNVRRGERIRAVDVG